MVPGELGLLEHLPMTTTKDWEAGFDSHRPWTYLGFEIDPEGKKVYLTDEIKAFIRSLLLAQKDELAEIVKEHGHQQDDDTIWCNMDEVLAALDV